MGYFSVPANDTVAEQIKTAQANLKLFRESLPANFTGYTYLLGMIHTNLESALRKLNEASDEHG